MLGIRSQGDLQCKYYGSDHRKTLGECEYYGSDHKKSFRECKCFGQQYKQGQVIKNM